MSSFTTSAISSLNLTRVMCERNSSILEKENNKYTKSIVQNRSKQDACGYVHTNELSILWCSDSHGGQIDKKHRVIRDFLNSISDEKWIEYVSQEDFHKDNIDEELLTFKSNLFRDIAANGPYKDTGATLSIVTITPTHIVCYRVGDSPIYVFRDGENILYSDHNEEWETDLKELKQRDYFGFDIHSKCSNKNGVIDTPDIIAVSAKVMTHKPSYYVYWDCGSATNMSRAIGHNDLETYGKREKKAIQENKTITLSLPKWTMTKTIIERLPESKEKIIVASDGVSAVCGEFDYPFMYSAETAVDIMEIAYDRWKQNWLFKVEGYDYQNNRIPDWNRDDMAIVTWNN